MRELKSIFVFILFIFIQPSSGNAIDLIETNYEETKKVLLNPDRGFYQQLGGGTNHTRVYPYLIQSPSEKSYTVNRIYFPLRDFYKTSISKDYLDNLENVLKAAEDKKITLIPRFYYVWGWEKGKPFRSPSTKIIKQHVSQLAKVLNQYPQSISFIEMGFLGAWGEWHSDQYGSTSKPNSFRKKLIQHILNEFSEEIYFALRYPADRKRARKLNGIERVGLHHDCPNYYYDTYKSTRAYKITIQAPQGGEVCNQKTGGKKERNYGCEVMLKYFDKFNFDVLNGSDWAGSNSRFKRQGCWEEIRDRLGYRYVLTGSKYKDGWLYFSITNKGFGKSFKPRKLSLLVDEKVIETDIDVRNWLSGKSYVEKIKVGNLTSSEGLLQIEGDVLFANTTGNKVFFNH